MLITRLALGFAIFAASAFAQDDFGMGFMGEFRAVSKELTSLAEKTPADKYSWRPAPGVRSVSEVYIHIAVAHLFFLNTCGVKVDMSKARTAEKTIVNKDEVIAFLKDSMKAVEENYPKLDMKKAVKFSGKDTTVEGIMYHLIGHSSEHLGQSIAYARVNGIVPPWSEPSK
jgi:uncharacterized damage-inducible protein DinB